ncbi:MAG TPA: hypothetical protein VHS27_07960 [Gaiellales bacterium]|nr:hypothetical protein [Gaiellales bacterium]
MNGSRQADSGLTPWGGTPHGWGGWLRRMWRVLVPGRRWRP